jgi:predicted ferric reductase
LEALDDGTVVITAEKPENLVWRATAGQYVFVQVPAISRFQWHPFTVSACIKDRLQVHIKADGDWTRALHKLAVEGIQASSEKYVRIGVGIDGPFGAPAQNFHSYEKAIIIGAGM